jgi:hypothetical protein
LEVLLLFDGKGELLMKVLAVIVGVCALFCLAGMAFFLRGCMTSHSRSHGHNDISFDLDSSGRRIVFNGMGKGGRDLFVLDLETMAVERLTDSEAYETAPSWSKDGKAVVYSAGLPGDRADHIFRVELATRAVEQLTFGDFNDTSPSFSSDGSTILFAREGNYRWGGKASSWNESGEIYRMKADGSDLTRLRSSRYGSDPQISPDGRRVLWSELDSIYFSEESSMDSPGVPWERGSGPRLSQDGQKVAFTRGQYSPDLRIYVRDVGEERPMLLDFTPKSCFSPRFGSKEMLYFLVESWTRGPTGSPSRELWRADLRLRSAVKVAGTELFDRPLGPKTPD